MAKFSHKKVGIPILFLFFKGIEVWILIFMDSGIHGKFLELSPQLYQGQTVLLKNYVKKYFIHSEKETIAISPLKEMDKIKPGYFFLVLCFLFMDAFTAVFQILVVVH